MRKPENSHFSLILLFWAFSHCNLLPCNSFQLKQIEGFLGFPEKFSGGGIWGEGVPAAFGLVSAPVQSKLSQGMIK
jgi:hypothetical protein